MPERLPVSRNYLALFDGFLSRKSRRFELEAPTVRWPLAEPILLDKACVLVLILAGLRITGRILQAK